MLQLPSDSVTLLFTDIEGSTQLLRRLGDGYARVLAEHHRLLRQAFARHGGHEVDTQGDSFFVAFARPLDAVRAAAETQQSLAAHPWPVENPVRVRMGLHTGRPLLADDRYIGLDVHRAARIEAAAHGGQVVLSQATARLIEESLPEGLELRSLGAYRLKDFDQPQPLFQLLIGGLPASFPPLRTQREEPEAEESPAPLRLVGREAELEAMRGRLRAAQSGRGSLTLLAGEPGIGKTRLAEELAAEARREGTIVLWGRCWEVEGAPPFWPWRELLRGYAEGQSPLTLRVELGRGMPDVARLVPEVAERLGERPEETDGSRTTDLTTADPEAARFRLFDAISRFLLNASRAQPLLLVLDDLHWADKASLLLLQFLTRDLGPARIVILGTYRDTDLDRLHPLTEVLPSLRRAPNFERLLLNGLSLEEVQWLLESRAGHKLDAAGRGLAEALQRETEGNPFFIGEVLRHLAETGRLQQRDGRWTLVANVAELGIPEGIREVIGRRLSRLSDATNRLLTMAAVIGREFETGLFERMSGLSGEAVDEAIEAAETARVIDESGRGGRYRFSHALVQETLYAELASRRRVRLHRQVGEALEQQHARNLEPHLPELAYHFLEAGSAGDAEKAVDYARRAGQQALEQGGYETAARLFEQALQALEESQTGDDARRCDLLLELGQALIGGREPGRVMEEVAPRAFDLAEALRDQERAARAASLAMSAMISYGAALTTHSPERQRWRERFDRYAAADSPLRVRADIGQAAAIAYGAGSEQAWPLFQRTLASARRLQDPATLVYAVAHMITTHLSPLHWQERLRLARQYKEIPLQGVPAHQASVLLWRAGDLILASGDRAGAEAAWSELMRLAERTRYPEAVLEVLVVEGQVALLDGHLDEAIAIAMRVADKAAELGSRVWGLQFAGILRARPLVLLGRESELSLSVDAIREALGGVDPPIIAGSRARSDALQGRRQQAWTALQRFLAEDGPGRSMENALDVYTVEFLETALVLGAREEAARLAGYLEPLADTYLDIEYICAGRLLGDAAVLNEEYERARGYYERGLAVAERIRSRPEIALLQLALAELETGVAAPHLVTGAAMAAEKAAPATGTASSPAVAPTAVNTTSPRDRLAFAVPEFEAMGMKPALERARRLRHTLA